MKVQVLDMNGHPINHTSPHNAKEMLKKNIAEVIQEKPFIIKLKVPTGPGKRIEDEEKPPEN